MVKVELGSCFAENREFHLWQMNNKYFGKRFSILGDSISTLEGYNPKGYKVFYGGDNCIRANVLQMSDTWWDKVISFLGGELLINNSWSGSRVTKLPGMDQLFPSGCSDERTSSLHTDEVKPDVILVYIGTNDWAFGVKIGNEVEGLNEDENEQFGMAYDKMLQKLRKNYPQSEIWCCTLCETFMSRRHDFQFPHKYAGTHIEEYNDIIRKMVSKNICKLLDLYNYKMPYDSIDGTHPNSDGMNTLATMMIRTIAGAEVSRFMDCDNNNYEFVIAEKYGDEHQDKYVGKIVGEKYLVQKLIGRGGFFTTYLVQDIRSNKTWLMNVGDKTYKGYSPAIRENILQKCYMIMKMKHPVILAVVDIVEDDESLFIVREYAEGVTLESIVKDFGAQSADKVIEWGKQLCDMLGYLHKCIPPHIYGDMRPANVILTSDKYLKVTAFGIVRIYDLMKGRDTGFLETREYAAPEQFAGGRQVDERTNIFNLGMMLHYLVTGVDPGKPPYETKPICQVNPNLPKGLEYIISKCTQINPDKRYQNCDELMSDLNNYMNLTKPKRLFAKLFKE